MTDNTTAEQLVEQLAAELAAAPARAAAQAEIDDIRGELLAARAMTRPARPTDAELMAAASTPFPKPVNATALDLFRRIKAIEQGDTSWPAGDTVELLCAWFEELGFDPDAPASAYIAAPGAGA